MYIIATFLKLKKFVNNLLSYLRKVEVISAYLGFFTFKPVLLSRIATSNNIKKILYNLAESMRLNG